MNWYALYTKPKHEDLVADRLHTLGIETLNLKLKRYSSTAINEHTEPLFPCYLFAKFDESKYTHLITYSRGVKYIVGKDRPIVVSDEIIDALKKSTDDGTTVVITSKKFQNGDRVLIKEGPLRDFYGTFERERNGNKRGLVFLTILSSFSCKVVVNSCCLTRA